MSHSSTLCFTEWLWPEDQVFFYQSRFAPARAEISGLPKEYRKRGRIGKKGSVYFTEKSFSMDILSNMIFWRGTGANLLLAK